MNSGEHAPLRKWAWPGGILAALAALVLYGLFDPAKVPFPRCPFFALTGLKCPGCGSQRAVHQLLHLHIGTALGYNALFVLMVPVLLLLLAACLLEGRSPALRRLTVHPILGWTFLALILLWWLVRNLAGW